MTGIHIKNSDSWFVVCTSHVDIQDSSLLPSRHTQHPASSFFSPRPAWSNNCLIRLVSQSIVLYFLEALYPS
ncbi:hypothetical protein CBOM_06271 [Ceraceosorus bombacis]|uniref:Uncharacterized protein n=1 Tax=Ceraceosorus bombacis TaxID=401625 RepID=A0A0P1A3C7_9BASI|nr:hypothetical protein CBOM_06271 [Ceraceosorus bombacis]